MNELLVLDFPSRPFLQQPGTYAPQATPVYYGEQTEPRQQQQQQHHHHEHQHSSKAPRNPLVVTLQCIFCGCGILFLVIGMTFGISALTFGSAFSDADVDTSEYEANSYSIPFQQSYTVNGTAKPEGIFLTLEAAAMVDDLSKMRLCFSKTATGSNVTGVAQAIIPYTSYEYDGAYDIQKCVGFSAAGDGGVGMCSTGEIYVAVYGNNEAFTLDIYYDYCHTDIEDCYCDYVVIYLIVLMVFLFSVGVTICCFCCACCNTCCCWGLCALTTVIDASSRRRAEVRPLVIHEQL